MPYIKQHRRAIMDSFIRDLGLQIKSDGELNYVITRLLDDYHGAGEYDELNQVMGILSCIAQEFYRRRVSVLEDAKRLENGEVFK